MGWQDTELWQRTLGQETDIPAERPYKERLRVALFTFRDNASVLADQIPGDLPGLTDHSVRHMDSLWEVASLLAAGVPINPLEAFVFGGAVLLHDLANCVAAFQGGLADLRGPEWNDIVHATYRKRLGRPPTLEEVDDPEPSLKAEILLARLRGIHARQAEVLATQGFYVESDRTRRHHLIFDEEIREKLGPLIGRIAHSHHWDMRRVEAEWSREPFAAPPPFPSNWSIDRLKVAVLLRSADAAQIDSRRAPSLALAIRQPLGESLKHWNFQNHLNRPSLQNGRLVYQSYRPFARDEAESWWLCFDVLGMIHGELSRIDDVLRRRRPYRLAASGVLDHDSAESLQSRITVEGWIPIDARISVGQVTSVVERLGGERLYGKDPNAPLRELIANAADAIRARRAIEERESIWGRIDVRVGKDETGDWLEVEDNGIGMSAAVLRGPLLEFGTSYWTSPLAREEHPGLYSRGFTSTGEFGIGFFSIFMLGTRVRVLSQPISKPGAGVPQPHVLEFENGLASRPLMRLPDESEWPREPGTRVRVWLRTDPNLPKLLAPDIPEFVARMVGRLTPEQSDTRILAKKVARVAPCLDVDTFATAYGSGPVLSVAAEDWLRISFGDLSARLGEREVGSVPGSLSRCEAIFTSSGHPIARLGIPATTEAATIITVGGLATLSGIPGFPGVIRGGSPDLARHKAEPMPLDIAEVSAWLRKVEGGLATQVANFERQAFAKGSWYASLYLEAGLRPNKIPCFLHAGDLVSAEQLLALEIPEKVSIVLSDRCQWGSEGDVQITSLYGNRRLLLLDNVIIAPVVRADWIHHYLVPVWGLEILPDFVMLDGERFPWCLPLLCLETIALKLGCNIEELVRSSIRDDDGALSPEFHVKIGTYAGEDLVGTVLRLEDPKISA